MTTIAAFSESSFAERRLRERSWAVEIRDTGCQPKEDSGHEFVSRYQKECMGLQTSAWLVLLVSMDCVSASPRAEASTNVVLWDTSARSADTLHGDDRTGWKPCPTIFLRSRRTSQSSVGSRVLRQGLCLHRRCGRRKPQLTAVFWSAKGRVVIYSKDNAAWPGGAAPQKVTGAKWWNSSLQMKSRRRPSVTASSCDTRAMKSRWKYPFLLQFSGRVRRLFLRKVKILEIKPAESMKGISLLSPLEYGIVPASSVMT